MRALRAALAVSAFALTTGCFHQVVNTGLPPSSTVVQKAFHPTWVFGLVKAQPIDVRQQCPNGIALAGTRMTFMNGLVGGLTLGLFTPHEVTITCAAGQGADAAPASTRTLATELTAAEFDAALALMVREVAQTGAPMVITFAPASAGSLR
jgi:hypothetical protein